MKLMARKIVLIALPFMILFGCSEPADKGSTVEYEAVIPLITPPSVPPEEPIPGETWTVLCYMDADNNLESYLMNDVLEMASGLRESNINIIVLIDRIPGYTSVSGVFYTDFADARLFRIIPGAAIPLSGGTVFPAITTTTGEELNMGDANTLKKFIQFGKQYYPADHYALIMSNHGGGARSALSLNDERMGKAVCWDDTDGEDALYTAEITDVLTADESVDLLIFDACYMGSVEVAYQYRCHSDGSFADDRFGALYFVASAPTVWGYGLPYDRIFDRLRSGGGSGIYTAQVTGGGLESYLDPDDMTAEAFGSLFVEEQHDDTAVSISGTLESFFLLDLSVMDELKQSMDDLSVALTNQESMFQTVVFGSDTLNPAVLAYFDTENVWLEYPYFDLYDMADKLKVIPGLSTPVSELMESIDNAVVWSFAGSGYSLPGYNGRNGLSIFCPDGDMDYGGSPHWAYQWWYNAIDTATEITLGSGAEALYGKLAWCTDGATSGDSTVDNWFELLDSWYDTGTGGGYNNYSY
jgi:clostripain